MKFGFNTVSTCGVASLLEIEATPCMQLMDDRDQVLGCSGFSWSQSTGRMYLNVDPMPWPGNESSDPVRWNLYFPLFGAVCSRWARIIFETVILVGMWCVGLTREKGSREEDKYRAVGCIALHARFVGWNALSWSISSTYKREVQCDCYLLGDETPVEIAPISSLWWSLRICTRGQPGSCILMPFG